MANWKSRIKELRDSGLTLEEIGAQAGGIPASTIGDLATGRSKSPRWEAAVALLNLHSQRCTATQKRA